jgi:hypothetical protein
VWLSTFSLCLLAELCLRAGCPEEGRAALTSIGSADRQTFWASEVHRVEGELIAQGGRSGDGEPRFRTAIELARSRGEKSLRDEARHELTEIYGWFTEGLNTTDLRQAKKLFDELSTSGR